MTASRSWLVCACYLGLTAFGCTTSAAQESLYDTKDPRPLGCHALLLDSSQVGGPYRQLAKLSATCSKLQRSRCEQLLLARACELGADAVLIESSEAPPPLHTIRRSEMRVTEEAVAVRYEHPRFQSK